MFKFTDLSDDDVFKPETCRLDAKAFWEKRRTSSKPYVFDLRSPEDHEAGHLPGANSLPVEHFENSIYQMPFTGDILIYGSENGEALTAGEILYDNGFDTFGFTEDFEGLYRPEGSWLSVTDDALKILRDRLTEESAKAVRIEVESSSPLKGRYAVAYVPDTESVDDLIGFEVQEVPFVAAREVVPFLEGTEIFINGEDELEIQNPNLSVKALIGSIEEQVQTLLDDQVNPMVAGHGGVVSLRGIEDGKVYLEFGGGCQGCGMIDVTLKQGVEVAIKDAVPEIEEVVDITDHDSGSDPYYKPSKK
ncbi:MAG: NifU family protein [SAR324 cluster bacterium]|nr:NifU family protein [SAR324 cluster bacterium]